jgi:putative ABC transport system permease protein
MEHLSLITAAFRRKPARTVLTMLAVAIAFLLFGLLQGVSSAFDLTLARMKLDRLFVDSPFATPLPLSYREQIAKVPGVVGLTEIAFLRTYFGEPKNVILVIATKPADWLGMRPEYTTRQTQLNAVARTRNGVIIADWLARQYGWKVGDRITLLSRPTATTASTEWTFEVSGIMTYADPSLAANVMLANFAYYDDARPVDRGTANRFLVRIDSPLKGAQIGRQIDALFATSGVQTYTQSEQETGQAEIATLGDIQSFTSWILGSVFFTLLILTGHTMMESVRERTRELAILKVLGYSDAAVLGLVIAESVGLCIVASGVGLAMAAALFPLAGAYAEITSLPPRVLALGLAVAVAVGLVSALIPAWRALRLRIVDALAMQ